MFASASVVPPRHRGRRLASAALLIALLTGCSSGTAPADVPDAPASEPGAPLVLTTFTVLADIARQVSGEHLRVESITKPGAEIHGYEPTPSDLKRAEGAALIIDNGLGLEAWFEQFVEDLEVPHAVASEGVEIIDIAEDASRDLPNPHAWMSPVNAQIYVDNLVRAFSDLDPEHAAEFAANGSAYSVELQRVQDELIGELQHLPERQRALVTCEGAFSYLARDAGLSEQYIWAVNAEQQATPRQIASVIEYVREHEVPAVFCESTVSDTAMRQVVASTDASFGGVLYVDSLSDADGPVPSYLDLLRHDAALIVDGLTGDEA